VNDLTERSLAELMDNIVLTNLPPMTVRPTHVIVTPEGVALKARMSAQAEWRRLRNRRKREAKR
jgi:hypothetical protein